MQAPARRSEHFEYKSILQPL